MSVEHPIRDKFAPLWALLRGHGYLWHRTTLEGLKGIFRDGQISPNTGQLAETYGQSRVSYAWHLGAVSLFEFDTSCEPYIFDHEWKWGTVLTKRLPAGVVIGIPRRSIDPSKLLLPSEILANDYRLDVLPEKIRRGRMVIPAVEALHIGPIDVRMFHRLILTAYADDGGYLIYEADMTADVLSVLSAKNSEWTSAGATVTEDASGKEPRSPSGLLHTTEINDVPTP